MIGESKCQSGYAKRRLHAATGYEHLRAADEQIRRLVYPKILVNDAGTRILPHAAGPLVVSRPSKLGLMNARRADPR